MNKENVNYLTVGALKERGRLGMLLNLPRRAIGNVLFILHHPASEAHLPQPPSAPPPTPCLLPPAALRYTPERKENLLRKNIDIYKLFVQ